ncbi:pyridoxamine 5'-phosphate oxidase family protein [Paraflavisolibacter sp. H34]|uniref:pyridoxamine 5'-phosphate oxidase family protein n=1 Tax=Huijunlia imazamoxiresistens TaxID=3127457 RepID=UPI003016CB7A
MPLQQQLSFLQEKIQDIRSAIFFNLSDAVLKFPTSLVSTLKVDEYGYVWFLARRPRQEVTEFEAGFPVRLDYYRKGTNYFMQVTGRAWVVSDPEEMNQLAGMLQNQEGVPFTEATEAVLVKVKMLQAECHELQLHARHSWWQSAVNTVSTWFRNSGGAYRAGTFVYDLAS